jgi:hypothetical protein
MRKIFHINYSKGQYVNDDIHVYADYFDIESDVFIFYEIYDDNENRIVACYPIVNTAIWLIEELKNTTDISL